MQIMLILAELVVAFMQMLAGSWCEWQDDINSDVIGVRWRYSYQYIHLPNVVSVSDSC